jgi:Tol biopolymer transport system component
VVPFAESYDAGDPAFSRDGNRLFFSTWRPPPVGSGLVQKENIWYVDREGNGWSDPVVLSPAVNGLDLHWQFSIANDGDLYFTAQPMGSDSNNDIYLAILVNGIYSEVERLSDIINTDFYEDTPYIAPNESYIIFSRVNRSMSNADFYISHKNSDGTWRAPVAMNALNTTGHELCPCVTPDGLYLFFMSTRQTGISRIYWVSSEIIDLYE